MSNKNNNRISKAMSRASFNTLQQIGAANGINNRARTQLSEKEKAYDPRRQRREFKQNSYGWGWND